MVSLQPASLLNGPRGRRLLLELACARNQQLEELMYTNLVQGLDAPACSRVVVELARATADLEFTAPTELELLHALGESASRARYWQEPDPEDQLLGTTQVSQALQPLARVVAAHAPNWWVDSMADVQHRVPPDAGYAVESFDAWQAEAGVQHWYRDTVREETHAQTFIPDPDANYTGMWWSTPAHAWVPMTTRVLEDKGPVALWAQEDAKPEEFAVSYPVSRIEPHLILEITSVHDYARLVERYPLRMTRSKFHDWYRVTGTVDEWYVPHWGLISKDFDAVHLTTAAYLESATKRIPISGGSTVMAGWSPDVTIWLKDRVELGGRPREWKHTLQGTKDLWLAA